MALPRQPAFLSDERIEELTNLVPFPDSFKGDYDHLYACRFNYPYTSPAQRRAIADEDLMGMFGAPLQEVAAPVPVTASLETPWAPRGQSQVPTIAGNAVMVLDTSVPTGYVCWLYAYTQGLFPSQANELNYQWSILVNGEDIMNKTPGVAFPGRAVQSNTQVLLGYTKDEMMLLQPGARVQVTVKALSTLGATDSVSAAVFGILEGIK